MIEFIKEVLLSLGYIWFFLYIVPFMIARGIRDGLGKRVTNIMNVHNHMERNLTEDELGYLVKESKK